jgi:hypothetical protein
LVRVGVETWGVKRKTPCKWCKGNELLEEYCHVYTKAYKRKYGVTGHACVPCRQRHKTCSDDGSGNLDPNVDLHDLDEAARIAALLRRKLAPQQQVQKDGDKDNAIVISSTGESDDDDTYHDTNVDPAPDNNASAHRDDAAAMQQVQSEFLAHSSKAPTPLHSLPVCVRCGGPAVKAFLTSRGHLLCEEPCIRELESLKEDNAPFGCPGCGEEATKMEAVSPNMLDRTKPILDRASTQSFKKRDGDTLKGGDIKRLRPHAPTGISQHGSLRSTSTASHPRQELDTPGPANLFKDIHQALIILDKRCINMQKGMLELRQMEVANARNIQEFAELFNRVKEHLWIDGEFLEKMQSLAE